MKDERKAPKLRFKGFTDDWEQCKLGDVARIVGGGTPSTKKSEYWNGNINWFTPAEIGNQIFVSHSKKKITELGLLKSSAKILPAGAILFTSRAGIGNTAILTRNACTNQGFQSIVPYSNKLDSYFIYSESAKLKRYGETMGSGSTFTEVSGKQMKKMSLHIPNINEQAKIGNMLKILDQIITLHEEKKRQLERLKSALMQKMFADKSGYPPVRFEGFSNEWEHCKLGDVADITTGSRNHQDSVTDGKYPFFVRSDKVERLNEYDFDTKAILVPGDGRIGEIFHYYNGKFALHQRVYKVDNFNGINELFLLGLFKYSFKEHALRLNAQGTVPSLRLPMFTNWSISVPMITEQERIGVFFQKLERTISLYDHKLELLKKVKRSMLQAMFI
ncbi:restriction endonuclease subunit S [Lactobacillus delbrueckii subsp. bulgaricus]|nr:restriction endonuclease subunit S [Lactobacillus delbrueckii subsp. bulgaricus]MBT9041248.1 restriction endonuclease subunit S [Lactobacillus delbrueckii subsp. bulgaricus]